MFCLKHLFVFYLFFKQSHLRIQFLNILDLLIKCLDLFGTCLEHFWNIFGNSFGSFGKVLGTFLGHFGKMFGEN